ncbi:MAG: dockerin type I domain-containing protein [Saprospiraceae bacterium]
MRILFISVLLLVFTPLCGQFVWQDTVVGFGVKPDVAIFDETIYIAYLSEANSGYAKCAIINDNEITNETISSGYFYGPLDIKIDKDGNPRVTYHDHNTQDLSHVTRVASAWILSIPESDGHDGWDGSIYIDDNNKSHIVSIDPSNGVEYALQTDEGWVVETVDSRDTDYKFATSIASHDGNIFLTYFITSTTELVFAEKINDVWSFQTIDSDGIFPSMIINSDGNPVIAYYQRGITTDYIAMAERRNGAWEIERIEEIEDIVVNFTGARKIVDLEYENDTYHIAFSNKKKVRYGTKNESSWDIHDAFVVNDENQVLGQQTSLDINIKGMPVISFYERSQTAEGGGIIHMIESLEKDTTTGPTDSPINFKTTNDEGKSVDNVSLEVRDINNSILQTLSDSDGIKISKLDKNAAFLCAKKSDNPQTNVSAIDLVRMTKMVLSSSGPCRKDFIAADVNKSGSVSAIDIILTLNVILGKSSGFQNDDSWRFYDSSIDVEALTLTDIYDKGCISIEKAKADKEAIFIGVKLGDIICNP